MITDGTVRAVQVGTAQRVYGPGDSVGALEALTGLRHRATLEVITPVSALWCRGSSIVDILEDHTDLGLRMIETFSGALLDRATHSSN